MLHCEEQATLHPIRANIRPDIHSPPAGYSQNETIESQLTSQPDDQLDLEDHFSINIDLAWTKLNEYYSKLDNSPVYVASVVLHPCHEWRWLEAKWKERPHWLSAARTAFNELANQYRYYERPEHLHSPAKRQKTAPDVTTSSDSYPSDEEEDQPPDIDQQLANYKRDSSYRHLKVKLDTSPIEDWLNKRLDWPQLAALALDIFAIPVMSDEPERVFSVTGAAVHPRRRALLDDTINNLMTVKAWSQSGLIKLDRYGSTFTSTGTSGPC